MAHVSERALIQRINRKLAPEGEVLKKSRSSYNRDTGMYWIQDWRLNTVIAGHVDLENLGKELGVIRLGEVLRIED